MTDSTLELLRHAVNIARERQIAHLGSLRAIMNAEFPGRNVDVDDALHLWASYVARHRVNP